MMRSYICEYVQRTTYAREMVGGVGTAYMATVATHYSKHR